jgi:hypothetical protein
MNTHTTPEVVPANRKCSVQNSQKIVIRGFHDGKRFVTGYLPTRQYALT